MTSDSGTGYSGIRWLRWCWLPGHRHGVEGEGFAESLGVQQAGAEASVSSLPWGAEGRVGLCALELQCHSPRPLPSWDAVYLHEAFNSGAWRRLWY